MIYITENEGKIIEYLVENPNQKAGAISAALKIKDISARLTPLWKKGAIERSGTNKNYVYWYSGKPYKVGIAPRVWAVKEVKLDKGLQAIQDFRLSEEQLLFIKSNKHLSRTELAKRLGISKLELNQAMVMQKLHSKVTTY